PHRSRATEEGSRGRRARNSRPSDSRMLGPRGCQSGSDSSVDEVCEAAMEAKTPRPSGSPRRRSTYKETSHDLTGESVYRQTPMDDGLRGSPSLVGRWIANPVRSAPGGSNPPPRANV